MSGIITRLLPLALVCQLFSGSAGAQQPNRPLSLDSGDAVVTGFSGTIAPDPGKPHPANRSAIDLTTINPDGPSARVIGVARPGYVWDGRVFQAPKSFDVFAKDTGQVFGVALDDATAPNIYLAATSAFGLNLVSRGADGQPERRKAGGPGTGWMKGQFGLELQGDPGSIYKVDGTTGVVTLFAKVMLDGVPNPGPALGNLAYDAAHKQLFVSDLYTGMIHRFAVADGSEPGAPYDHGVTGRGAVAGLPPMPFNPANRPNIANNKFNAEDPDTWGYAPTLRRVWGLAVQAGRLFYSVRNGAPEGPQIWSVSIAPDGSLGTDASLEVEVAAQPGPYPVSDIAFSSKGAMILAQRAPVAASYDYSAFTKPGEPRVLRYWLKDASDPPSPGLWKPMPEEYAVGFAGSYRNTDGGVALGYGYGPDGMVNGGACEAALWTSGQNLRNNPILRSQLEPGGPLVMNGLQGSPADMVRDANTPPAISYFVDYDDRFDDPATSGHMGGVRILAQPCAGPIASYRPPSNPPMPVSTTTTPTGCVGPDCPKACTPTCICPPGTVLRGRECVKVIFATPTPTSTSTATGTQLCPPPLVPGPTPGTCKCQPGAPCVCPPGMTMQDGLCVPTKPECRPPFVPGPTPGSCVCPQGTVQQGRTCIPQICPSPLVPGPCTCPPGTVQEDGMCIPVRVGILIVKKTVENHAPKPIPNSTTYPISVNCTAPSNLSVSFNLPNGGSHTENNIPAPSNCTVSEGALPLPNVCPPRTTPVWTTSISPNPAPINGSTTTTVNVLNVLDCKPIHICPPPLVMNAAGECVCPQGTTMVDGKCVPIPKCPAPQVMMEGKCVCPPPMLPGAAPNTCACPQGSVLRGGQCVKVETCSPREVLNAAGICVIPEPKRKPKVEKRQRRQDRDDEPEEPRRQPRIDIDRIPGIGIGGGGRGGFGGGGQGGGGESPGRR